MATSVALFMGAPSASKCSTCMAATSRGCDHRGEGVDMHDGVGLSAVQECVGLWVCVLGNPLAQMMGRVLLEV